MLTFNIVGTNAADVTLQLEYDNNLRYISSDFKSVLNLPHPIVFKQMLDNPENSSSGKLLLLGIYFDAKYPDDAIEYDFSEDVAVIFPHLNANEVMQRTSFIRSSIKTYRWGKEKYKQLASDIIVPKEPPLLVDDDEYAFIGTVDYVPVPAGSFAVINDFKKIVSYSNEKKDVEAMEAYTLRQLEKKENKTDYEKFKSMINKIEFSKIPSYGVDLPNPFIGNVGIGKWIEQDAYKARTVSDTAQIYNAQKIMAGLHINVPNHRFMLANNIAKELHKPKIELIDKQNIKSYKVQYPMSVPLADEKMIHAYSGDFIFPITIETLNPQAQVKFKTKITFYDCDFDLNCTLKEIVAPLHIENGPDNMSSAIKSFVVQSHYSIPSEENKYIKLEDIYATTSQNSDKVKNIHLILSYKKTPKNISVLLEDDIGTEFSASKININDDKIYVSIEPLSNQDNILNKPISVTVRLNAYSSLRKVVILKNSTETKKVNQPLLNLIFMSLFVGLSFYITPIGLMLLCLSLQNSDARYRRKNIQYWFISALTIILSMILFSIFILYGKYEIFWGTQYNNMFYFNLCILIVLAIMLSVKYKQKLLSMYNKIRAVILSCLIMILFTVSQTPYLETLYNRMNISNTSIYLYTVISIALGMVLPHIFIILWQTKYSHITLSKRAKLWLLHIGYYASVCAFIYLIGILFLQNTWQSFIKIMIVYAVCFLLYKYFYNFVDALYRTDLEKQTKRIAENIVLCLAFLTLLICAKKSADYSYLITTQTPVMVSQEILDEKIRQNQMIIVGINADWSYLSAINKFTTFSDYVLKRWKKTYNLEYIDINATKITPQIKTIMQEYNTYNLPIYILYTLNMNKGVVLPKFAKSTELEQLILNFKF